MLQQVGVGRNVFSHIEARHSGEETPAVDYRLHSADAGTGARVLFSRHEDLHGAGGEDYRSSFGRTIRLKLEVTRIISKIALSLPENQNMAKIKVQDSDITIITFDDKYFTH